VKLKVDLSELERALGKMGADLVHVDLGPRYRRRGVSRSWGPMALQPGSLQSPGASLRRSRSGATRRSKGAPMKARAATPEPTSRLHEGEP
jgi:hypothetical protein